VGGAGVAPEFRAEVRARFRQTYTPRVQRKTVTVFFSDVVGSTELGDRLDPEVLRRLLARYFDEVRSTLERHGGTLEKYIGDAVVALFGVPLAREDDALRALRAAAEIRTRLAELNDGLERDFGVRLAIRTGIHTGEVLVDPDAGPGITATGDTMNVAARLEQSATQDEILIGAQTRALGGAAIVVEEVEPLAVKGKAEPLPAYRLVKVLSDVAPHARREDVPLVGRRRELESLREALAQAEAGRECFLATVVGSPGVGKSRLARELLASLGNGAISLSGRCVADSEGRSFLALAEALEPILGPEVHARTLELLDGDGHSQAIAERTAAIVSGEGAADATEESFWALRRVLEAIAHERPLVLVLDDVHWAGPTLLDFVEYLAAFSRESPLVLVCLGRPDLLEVRPAWASPRENGSLTLLDPMDEEDSIELVRRLSPERELDAADLRRIVDAAEGNPLFLEQLLALNAGRGAETPLEVPPTIHALLQARIDRLSAAERFLLEAASVQGREFELDTVAPLVPTEDRENAGTNLLALARKQFVSPLRAIEGRQDRFSFAHALVRDAAYAGIPKQVRGDLHERVALRLEKQSAEPVEVVGHHLAEAVRYRREVGQHDERTREIARRAAERLEAGGREALGAGDDRAAARLLERALGLVAEDGTRVRDLRMELARALAGSGQLERSAELFSELRNAAHVAGDRILELHAQLGLASLRAQLDPDLPMSELRSIGETAIPELEAVGDSRGLARSWFLIHWALFRTGRLSESIAASEKVIAYSERARDSRERLRALGAVAMATLWGPTPVTDAHLRCDELLERGRGARLVDAFAARVRGGLSSMTGDFEGGREHCRRAAEIYEELGHPISAIGVVMELQRIERQAGRLDTAESELRAAYERLETLGDLGYVSWVGAALALVLVEQGEISEAKRLARIAREGAQRDHAYAQITARIAEALALAAEERSAEADGVAREALARVEETDMLDLHGDVLQALAGIDASSGRHEQAVRRLAGAIDFYERKGDVMSAERARARSLPLEA
jgi:class 3 adenylate cyclase/tetratricopeptide (TPR) repeat protein